MRTSINVLGDAYGCGIVEHLSRDELKKLDEEAEQEFTKIISANPNLIEESNGSDMGFDNKSPMASPKLGNSVGGGKFTDYNKFDGVGGQQNQQQEYNIEQEYQKQQQQQQPHPPSIVVMDAVRRRSRVLLFNTKLPTSVYSMPQISQYANNSNDDSNV